MTLPQHTLLAFTLVISLVGTASGQKAKLEGYIFKGTNLPASGVRVILPGAQAVTTDSKGHFFFALSDKAFLPGQPVRIFVANWKVFQPIYGLCQTQNAALARASMDFRIVPPGSFSAHITPERLAAILEAFNKQVLAQARTLGALRNLLFEKGQANKELAKENVRLNHEREKYAFLQQYAAEYEIPADQLKTVLDDWARTNRGKTRLAEALQEYWIGNIDKVYELTAETPDDLEAVTNQKHKWIEESRIRIQKAMLHGQAARDKGLLPEALASFRKVESLFEKGTYSKEDLLDDWVYVNVSIGITAMQVNFSQSRKEDELLAESLSAINRIQTVYSYQHTPDKWAAIELVRSIMLGYAGSVTEGTRGLRLLNESVNTSQAALKVLTEKKRPELWAFGNLVYVFVLNDLAERTEGSRSVEYLEKAATAADLILQTKSAQIGMSPENSQEMRNEIYFQLAVIRGNLAQRTSSVEAATNLGKMVAAFKAGLTTCSGSLTEKCADRRINASIFISFTIGLVAAMSGHQAWKDENEYRVHFEQGLAHLNYSAELATQVLATVDPQKSPRTWSSAKNAEGRALANLGRYTEGFNGINYLRRGIAAIESALATTSEGQRVFSAEKSPEEWASAQAQYARTSLDLALRLESAESIELLMSAARAMKASMTVYIPRKQPKEWDFANANLVPILVELALRTKASETISELRETVAAYKSALGDCQAELELERCTALRISVGQFITLTANGLDETGADPEIYRVHLRYAGELASEALRILHFNEAPRQWAIAQRVLAESYYLDMEWISAKEAYLKLLESQPDDFAAFQRLSTLYHEKLFAFDQAFEINREWLARNKDDLATQVNFIESQVTTGRFSEALQSIPPLIALAAIPDDVKFALRVLEIVCLNATHPGKEVRDKLEALIDAVSRQPAQFHLTWQFDGTLYFIQHEKRLGANRNWLEQLIVAVKSKDRDEVKKALSEARARLKGN